MSFVVGLTGGIGSGKSTVADLFAELGITLVDADIVARQVVEPGTPGLEAIVEHFGTRVLQADGHLDRAALRQLVFSNESERLWLNALLHPLIREEMAHQLGAAQSPYVLWVVPLLIENGLYQDCDQVLVVDASPELQRQRVLARDKTADAEAIMARQLERNERLKHATQVLDNSGDLVQLKAQVQLLHRQYLSMAQQKRL
ncbi:dephospho-CoA kinase [Gallaecimonas kandeliae]|uniref:dephospho-CoA kinase n=1 Tax=Gallaecimonas kandeliae TaxID=3029055 RepID=UPI00264963A0|nr:dephospho-CoA kinase [Gallaecimonas kandeliae]WKE66105.1 dephospho-CoA kinase [Gallaecimonas kandeliae]